MAGTTTDRAAPRIQRDVYSVSRLNHEVHASLEGGFPLLWIEGEISNLARPRSGHLYFSLKDPNAQVRCAMFRSRNMRLGFEVEDGMQVMARVQVSLYEPRGDFQLIVEHMEEAGDGALRRAFEALKQRLLKEGLFAAEHKQVLPKHPHTIGVVTSPSGAAIHDILSVLARRAPGINIILYPTAVQGEGAAEEIAATIRLAAQRNECDVLIVGRGGGSLEDLWAFNEEVVARAIHECQLPVVSAVGHEVDFTIADFVADHRSPTPSAAAELLSPDLQELHKRLRQMAAHLEQAVARRIRDNLQRLRWLQHRLPHPGRRLQEIGQRLDDLEQRMQLAQLALARHHHSRISELSARLMGQHPGHRLRLLGEKSRALSQRLQMAMPRIMENRGRQLAAAAHSLDTVSPLATLGRGYAIVSRTDGTVVRNSDEVTIGERVSARLGQGRLVCRVEEKLR